MSQISVNTLLDEVKCYACLGISINQLIKLALLRRILLAASPSEDVSVGALMEYAKCYACYGSSAAQLLELALLDKIKQTNAASCLLNTVPSSARVGIGTYVDATYPITSMTEVNFLGENTGNFFVMIGQPNLTTARFPNLITTNGLQVSSCPKLTSVEVPLLASSTSGGQVSFDTNVTLTNIAFPSLVSVGFNFTLRTSPLLSSVTFNPNIIFATGGSRQYLFNGCAFPAELVNFILARLRASNVVGVAINLTGGTNAAPTGQGLLDKAALITAGNTVNTN